MPVQVISTTEAPAAIGTYSQAVLAGDTLYISGQIPLDPTTGELVQGQFRDRADRVFRNLAAIAHAAGLQLSDVVKVTVYLTDLAEFTALNEVMSRHFSQPYPARAAVQVAALPKGTDVEIDAVLVRR
ncbi:MAG: RidA family protein [Pseudomonadales bacterium]